LLGLKGLGGLGILFSTIIADKLFYSLVLKAAVQMSVDILGAADQRYCAAILAHVFRVIECT